MATPVSVYAELAARHGDVDPRDMAAVERWYRETLPRLPKKTRREIVMELLACDGTVGEPGAKPCYPKQAPLPRLSDSPLALLVPPNVVSAFLCRLFRARRHRAL